MPQRSGPKIWAFVFVVLLLGVVGLTTSVGLAISLAIAKLRGAIAIPGYAATITVICFFGGLNSLGLGIIGEYIWRIFENTKARPHSITRESLRFNYPPGRNAAAPSRVQVSLPRG